MLNATVELLLQGTWQTLYMTLVSGLLASIGGIPLGVLLLTTRRGGLLHNPKLHSTVNGMTNIVRSVPFVILLVVLIPFTRFIVGTPIGTTAAIIPLSVSAIPFIGRMVESALADVNPGLIELGHAMGATPLQIIYKILLPEALPAMINGITITLIALVGYSAMAGVVGGGGLGAVAINYGYQRFDGVILLSTVIILIVLVQLLQSAGDYIVRRFSH